MRETQTLLEAATETIAATPTEQPIPAARALVPVEPPGAPAEASKQTDLVAVGVAGVAAYHAAKHVGLDPWLGALLGALWAGRR